MAFPALAQRYPEMRLAVPSEDLDYRALSIVYGVESVPVTPRLTDASRTCLSRPIWSDRTFVVCPY